MGEELFYGRVLKGGTIKSGSGQPDLKGHAQIKILLLLI
jgi:hypothetical protein